jgi:hypothetical protein
MKREATWTPASAMIEVVEQVAWPSLRTFLLMTRHGKSSLYGSTASSDPRPTFGAAENPGVGCESLRVDTNCCWERCSNEGGGGDSSQGSGVGVGEHKPGQCGSQPLIISAHDDGARVVITLSRLKDCSHAAWRRYPN